MSDRTDADIVAEVLAEYGLKPAEPEKPRTYPLRHGVRSGDVCFHNEHVVDSINRVVYCGTCGADLDPIHILHLYSVDPSWVTECRRERKRLGEEIAALKKELYKLRAAKRNATKGATR